MTQARARAEARRLAMQGLAVAVCAGVHSKLPYETVKGFEMVSTITYFPFLIVVPASSRFGSFRELIEAAKASPTELAYGSAGIGTTHHLAGELLARMARVKLLHVPYRGDAASTTALMGGEVAFTIAPATAVEANIRAGKLRALAVTGPQRWLGMPEVPTVADQGVPGYDVRSWAGWMLPAGSRAATVKRLNDATRQALLAADVRARLRQMGGEAQASTPAEMTRLVDGELRKWTQIVSESAIPKM